MKKMPNPVDRHVGTRVRLRRLHLGLSQEKLGDALGITFQQIQKYEKGANRIGASRLQQASTVLGVPVNYFFDGANAETAANGFAEPEAMPFTGAPGRTDEAALLAAFAKVNDAKLRVRIVELVEAMAAQDIN